MFVLNTTKKEITCQKNGFILCDHMGANSVSFFAELPKSAVVDHVKVNGVYLEDIVANKSITSHMDVYEEMKQNGVVCKCAATVNFHGDPPEIYNEIANYQVDKFEVFYHLEAIVEE